MTGSVLIQRPALSSDAVTAKFRAGEIPAAEFPRLFVPRLQFLLSQLEAHHQIEDLHYFPVFQAAEARLAHGFEVLEADHKAIHESIVMAVETANAFLRAPVNDTSPLHAAGERYAGASGALLRQLTRHLDDEEDLIIPLILDRTEAGLGVG